MPRLNGMEPVTTVHMTIGLGGWENLSGEQQKLHEAPSLRDGAGGGES